MAFHGKVGEAWSDWLAGYQRVYPPSVPRDEIVQEPARCGAKPPAESACQSLGAPHGGDPACECVLFRSGQGHPRHRALCGAVWGAS